MLRKYSVPSGPSKQNYANYPSQNFQSSGSTVQSATKQRFVEKIRQESLNNPSGSGNFIKKSDYNNNSLRELHGKSPQVIQSYFAQNAARPSPKKKTEEHHNYGSVFDQLRLLPSDSAQLQPKNDEEACSSSTSNSSSGSTTAMAEPASDAHPGKEFSDVTEDQRNKNMQLLSSWTEEGDYSRLQAMTIAAALYNTKVTEAEIRAELSPKEKFAYKKFCLEIDDKLEMMTRSSYRTSREPTSERTLRKMWHLYALYLKVLSDEIWDEEIANPDITSRAITHLVKRTIAGPDSLENQQLLPRPANPMDHINPVLSKCLQDPIHAFLIVYGRYCSSGRVNKVDRLRKLTRFNEIAEKFFDKLVEPPENVDIDTYLVMLKSEQQRLQKYQQSRHRMLPNFNQPQRSLSMPFSTPSRISRLENQQEYKRRRNNSLNLVTMKEQETVQVKCPCMELSYLQIKHGEGVGNDASSADMKSIQRKIQMLDGKKRICLVVCRYDVLPVVAVKAGFELVGENELWNINWSDCPLAQEKICQMRRIQDTYSVFWGVTAPLQKTNHFPGMFEICRKDRLGRNLNRFKRLFPTEFDFFPTTWDLPTEQQDLIAYNRRRKNLTFIIKPESGCQGKGIFLLRNLKKLSPFAKCVCQVYVPYPFLIDGYKFDQRIYVLITCVDPLRVYIYDEGIARFATVKYDAPTDENLEVVFMHLTNYSLNKFSESYVRDGEGSKRKVSAIYKWMAENGHDVAKLTRDIDDVIVKTLLCAAPTLRHNYKTCFPKKDRGCSCFELLGFDILLDRNLNPILLEVNHSPSFNLDLPVDSEVKTQLLHDMLNMVYLGEELSAQAAAASRQKMKAKGKGAKKGESSPQVKKSGRRKAPPRSPPSPVKIVEVDDCSENLPKPLEKQFQHEVKFRGKFRLNFSSQKPGRYGKLMEENYCGYQSLSPSNIEQLMDIQQVKKKISHRPLLFECSQEEWQETLTTSVIKITKRGQSYVETTVLPPEPSKSDQQHPRKRSSSKKMQKFRLVPASDSSVNKKAAVAAAAAAGDGGVPIKSRRKPKIISPFQRFNYTTYNEYPSNNTDDEAVSGVLNYPLTNYNKIRNKRYQCRLCLPH